MVDVVHMGTPGQSSGTESVEFLAEDDSSHSGDEESVAGDARDPLPELEVVALSFRFERQSSEQQSDLWTKLIPEVSSRSALL